MLNLVLVYSSELPAFRYMIVTIKKVTKFPSKSNKKIIVLKNVMAIVSGKKRWWSPVSLRRRWVERATAFERFTTNYVALVRALMAIRLWGDRDAKSKSQYLMETITDSTFITTLFTSVTTTDNFDTLSKNLQTVNKSLHDAMHEVQAALEMLKKIHLNSTEYFEKMFS